MKTQELNPVSSLDQAGLSSAENTKKSALLTPAHNPAMAQQRPDQTGATQTPLELRTPFCTQNTPELRTSNPSSFSSLTSVHSSAPVDNSDSNIRPTLSTPRPAETQDLTLLHSRATQLASDANASITDLKTVFTILLRAQRVQIDAARLEFQKQRFTLQHRRFDLDEKVTLDRLDQTQLRRQWDALHAGGNSVIRLGASDPLATKSPAQPPKEVIDYTQLRPEDLAYPITWLSGDWSPEKTAAVNAAVRYQEALQSAGLPADQIRAHMQTCAATILSAIDTANNSGTDTIQAITALTFDPPPNPNLNLNPYSYS
jgi:hypothetical protein